jgi:transcriptional regulator with XRE-family HTH domain
MNNTYQKIANTVKDQREKLTLSQHEFAKLSKTTVKNIEKLESGNFGSMRLNTFLRILNSLWLKVEIVDVKYADGIIESLTEVLEDVKK